MKIDIHDPPALLAGAIAGRRLVGTVGGTGDGTPGCATVQVERWRLD